MGVLWKSGGYRVFAFRRFRVAGVLPGDEGATAVEYGLMAGLIALVIIASVGVLGSAVQGLFTNAVDAWPR